MGKEHKYYIKLNNGRTVGPIDIDKIEALIRKKHIFGQEPTQKLPEKKWKSFTSYPELANLFLINLENHSAKEDSSDDTETIAATETLQLSESNNIRDSELDEMPTLLDIKKPEPEKEDPDLEKTQVSIQAPSRVKSDEVDTSLLQSEENATKVIDLRSSMPIVAEKPPAPTSLDSTQEESKKKSLFSKETTEKDKDGKPKKRLLSKATFMILVGGLMLGVFLSQNQKPPPEEAIKKLVPRLRRYKSPAIASDFSGAKNQDKIKAKVLIEEGYRIYERHNPIDYELASKKITQALVNDPTNIRGKSILAKIYMDMQFVIPNDQVYFEAISSLLKTPKGINYEKIPTIYIAAKAQYLLMLQQYDQAKKILIKRINRNPAPELLYWYAYALNEEGSVDKALMQASGAMKTTIGKHDPRILLLRAQMLAKKKQRSQAEKLFLKLIKEYPRFGAGRLHYMIFKLEDKKVKDYALKTVLLGSSFTKRPRLLDKKDLSLAYVTMARAFEELNMLPKSNIFLRFAKVLDPSSEIAEIMQYRILSRVKTKQSAYRQVLLAKQKEKLNQMDEAINAFFRARKEAPTDPVPLILLSKIYIEQNKLVEAINQLTKATKLRMKSPVSTRIIKFEAYFHLAIAYMNMYKLEEAKDTIASAEKVMNRKPKSKYINRFYISFLKGLLAERESNEELAIRYFKQSLAEGNTLPKVYVRLGQFVLEESIKSDDPKLSEAKKIFEEPKYELAEFYFTNALKNSPLDADALHGIALSRFNRDSPSSAIAFLKTKLEKYPRSPEVLTSLALIYFRSGNKVLGDRYIRKVIESNAKYAYAYKLFGDEAKKQGDRQVTHSEKKRHYLQAIRAYKIFNEFEPYNPDGYLAAANLFFFLRDYGSAAKNYHAVLKLRKNHPDVRLKLAKIALNGNETEKAEELIVKEKELFPESTEAHLELGKILVAKGDLSRAIQSFTEATRRDESSFEAIKWLAYAHFLKKDYETALALFQRALKIEPLNPDLHLRIAQTYDALANYDKAIQEYNNYKGLINDPAEVKRIQSRIKIIEGFTK